MADAPRNDPSRADPSRSYKGNHATYDQTRSRPPEQRRAERDARDAKRRADNLRGAGGVEKHGDVILAGPELTQPNNQGVGVAGGSLDLIVVYNAVLYNATFGNAQLGLPVPP